MIKIFKLYNYNGKLLKVNYVDHNNRFAGFDVIQQCCESAKHWIENSDGSHIEPDFRGDFDHLQFKDDEPVKRILGDRHVVYFSLINTETGEDYDLVFENCHNGWYTHDYEFGAIDSTTGYL